MEILIFEDTQENINAAKQATLGYKKHNFVFETKAGDALARLQSDSVDGLITDFFSLIEPEMEEKWIEYLYPLRIHYYYFGKHFYETSFGITLPNINKPVETNWFEKQYRVGEIFEMAAGVIQQKKLVTTTQEVSSSQQNKTPEVSRLAQVRANLGSWLSRK